MDLTVGAKLFGFTVTNIRPVPGENSRLVEMVFDRTATPLCWLDNGEENKLFCVAFKTLPDDSTGVFHILEHSVLCGSDKYPVKEPFVELIKSSMNTFLNAMTYPDKTMYPVSSRNKQDFLNLMNVYLDAVFAPAILKNPNIFYQEGWHLETLEGEPCYKGVVFNEMKGATSDVLGAIYDNAGELLFPDTGYGFNSGGDPRVIPDLSYEKFVRLYKENYHPTNARVYLDGDIPLEETLTAIADYLGRYEMGTAREDTFQTPISQESTAYFECPDKSTEGKSNLVLAKIVGSWEDKTRRLAVHVLTDVLAGSNTAPLKKAILDAGLGQDVVFSFVDGVLQPWYMLAVRNTDEDKFGDIEKTISGVIAQQLEEGIDKERLTASINQLSFRLRDGYEPRGLDRCGECLNAWLYNGDPMTFLYLDDAVSEMRAMAQNGGFEDLLRELFAPEGLCKLKMLPSLTYGQELREKEAARVKAEMDAWTDADREANRLLCEGLSAWQKSEDTPEGLATVPVLDLSEISEEPQKVDTTERIVEGVTVYHHHIPSKGVVHFDLRFNLSDMSITDLTKLTMLPALLGKLPTENYDAYQLQNEIKKYIGVLRYNLTVSAKVGQSQKATPWLEVTVSVLKENLQKAQELILEILTRTDFDQPDRIREIVLQAEDAVRERFSAAGHALARMSTLSHYSAAGAVNEAISGLTRMEMLHSFAKDFDASLDGFTALMKSALKKAVCKERLFMSATHDTDGDAFSIIGLLPSGEAAPDASHYESSIPARQGIKLPSQISFASIGCRLDALGAKHDGSLNLLANILTYGYLWNAVRVQGGAYGVGLVVSRSGDVTYHSFRDPSPANSLKVYASASDYMKAFVAGDESLDKFIISTIASTEPLEDPRTMGLMEDAHFLSGLTYEDDVRDRKEMLTATKEDLARWIPILDAIGENGAVCVAGHGDALALCGDLQITDL